MRLLQSKDQLQAQLQTTLAELASIPKPSETTPTITEDSGTVAMEESDTTDEVAARNQLLDGTKDTVDEKQSPLARELYDELQGDMDVTGADSSGDASATLNDSDKDASGGDHQASFGGGDYQATSHGSGDGGGDGDGGSAADGDRCGDGGDGGEGGNGNGGSNGGGGGSGGGGLVS
jgi:hypothetical protein